MIGRTLLEFIGYNNTVPLQTASDRNDGNINTEDIVQEPDHNQTVFSPLAEAVYRSAQGFEEDGLGNEDV